MKTNIIKLVVALITASAVSAYAATSGIAGEGSGPLVWALIGFGTLVIMLQAVPSVIMLVAMVKGLLAPVEHPTALPKA